MPDDPFGDAFGPLGPLVGRLLGDLDLGSLGDLRPPPGARGTHGLNRFGRDLTADARAGLLDPVIGRDDEIDQVIEVLARRTKNNPVLLGDPGVGKTAIVEGIARRIADGEVPAALREVRLVALDLAGMVAGTKYRGEFEERLTGLIREITAAGPSLIVFVDELHQVVGAGSAEGAPM
ncbi:MAG: ATP-dependent Clp protease ATP-binding subunit, partial [Pseudonocardia sp.]|nr:ATP-dependent Clp protease ATP-binding subunit [Pseudonocardia sp.]